MSESLEELRDRLGRESGCGMLTSHERWRGFRLGFDAATTHYTARVLEVMDENARLAAKLKDAESVIEWAEKD
jgi:hypothetical protein